MTADTTQLRQQMIEAAGLAARLVETLRAARARGERIDGGLASLALIFAAARVCKLRGVDRDTFVHVAGTMHDLSTAERLDDR